MPNPVLDCLLAHRSIRKFQKRAVEPEMLDRILQAGIRAPTAGNLQNYAFIVLDDPAKKRALWNTAWVDNPTVLIAVVDTYRMQRWCELNNAPFYFDQAINVFISCWDAIAALQNVCVAAESEGLGAVHIGMVLSMNLQEALGCPEHVFPAGLALIGYPDEAPALRPRLPNEAVIHRNGYHIPTDDEIRAYYREKDQEFERLTEAQRAKYAERGVANMAQRATVGHYSAEFIAEESRAVMENLARARFRLGEQKEGS